MFPMSFFPSLTPKIVDSLWFNVDSPCDEDSELEALESEHSNYIQSIGMRLSEIHPLGKPITENLGEEEDEEEDDDDNEDEDDDSDSRDEDEEDGLGMEILYDTNGGRVTLVANSEISQNSEFQSNQSPQSEPIQEE